MTSHDPPPTKRTKPASRQQVEPEVSSPSRRRTYEVVISYREPGYALHAGVEERLYTGKFRVRAGHDREACDLAISEFHEIARNSGVGWVRIIESISCKALDPP